MTDHFAVLPVDLADNPLLQIDGLPRFDQIEAHHVQPAVTYLLEASEKELSDLEASVEPTWDGCFQQLENIERPFEYCWSPVSHLLAVKNSDELREVYESVLDAATAFGLRMSQSQPIYEAAVAIRDGEEWTKLDPAQQRIVEKAIQSAERSGIALEGEQRERFNEIARELSQLSTKFSNNVLDSTKGWELTIEDKADVEGLPDSALAMAAQSFNNAESTEGEATAETGPWRFSLEAPSFLPFMQHCRNRELRENIYRAYISRASTELQEGEFDNEPLIERILELRNEKARLLGFESFAELSLDAKMAPDVAAVDDMLEKLRQASFKAAEGDLEELQALATESGETESLMHWDIAFWAERLRETRFSYTDEDLRPYLPLEKVLDGMFALTKKLFGITVREGVGVPKWHDDVRYFEVLDHDKKVPIAVFYLDPFSRPENKRGGAWMNTCLSRRKVDGVLQIPVAHLVCNSTPPVGDQPSLMTFREVETLFHEFGHGLQHMLTVIDHVDAAGINGIEWDAVELPSQFMENWCYHRPTVENFSGHVETDKPMPLELFDKLVNARTFRSGSLMLRQLNFGITDLALHSALPADSDGTAFDVQQRVSGRTTIMKPLPEDRFLCSFSHIFAGGYAAGYYSYKWAEILSADAFSAFEEVGLDNDPEVIEKGRHFRNTVLALGGSQHPLKVFQEFRGREPDPQALLRHSGLA